MMASASTCRRKRPRHSLNSMPSSPTTRPVALEYEAEDCPSFMTSASDYSRLRGRGFPPAPKSRLVPAPGTCDFGGGDGVRRWCPAMVSVDGTRTHESLDCRSAWPCAVWLG